MLGPREGAIDGAEILYNLVNAHELCAKLKRSGEHELGKRESELEKKLAGRLRYIIALNGCFAMDGEAR